MKNACFKILALLLALTMVLTVFAGCSSEGGTPDSGSAGGSQSGGAASGGAASDGDSEPAPADEPEFLTLGSEYADESDPAAAVAEKAAELLEALPEGKMPAWDDKSVTSQELPESNEISAALKYTLDGATVATLTAVWSREQSLISSLSLYINNLEDAGAAPEIQGALLSDSLTKGVEELTASLYAEDSWEYSCTMYTGHCGDGYILLERNASGYELVLRYVGLDLQREGQVLYSLRDGKASVFTVVDDMNMPQNFIIPETLGGCPVTDVTFQPIASHHDLIGRNFNNSFAIPKTCETVTLLDAWSTIFILPETVKTLACPGMFSLEAYTPIIICTGRETGIEMGEFVENLGSYTGRALNVQAFFGTELAEYAREHGWEVSYLDAIEGDRDAAQAYLSTLLDDRLAQIAAESPEAAAELAANVTSEELLELVMENWDDAMEDAEPQTPEALEQLEKLKAGDYSVLDSALQSKSDSSD